MMKRLLCFLLWVGARALGADFQPTIEHEKTPPGEAPANMVWIPGGEFSMGGPEVDSGLCSPTNLMDARPVPKQL